MDTNTNNPAKRARITREPVYFSQWAEGRQVKDIADELGISQSRVYEIRRMADEGKEIAACYEHFAAMALRYEELKSREGLPKRRALLMVRAEHGEQLAMLLAFLKGLGIKFARFEE